MNYLASVTPHKHLTLGATYKLSPKHELSVMAAQAYASAVKGTRPSTGMDVRMTHNWLGASWSTQW